ncbi:MAG: hypothetical protein E6I49_15755 [Chloroflexi bacterium]|nr:MAG: hypothetical protein E6I49_15755 [Chloroflexota bacterium]
MSLYRIGVIGGDGIGPEVTAAALGVLDACERRFGFRTERTSFPWSGAHYLATGERGTEVGDDVAEEIRRDHDVELLGLEDHPHRRSVDVHSVAAHVGEFLADLLEDVAPDLLNRNGIRLIDEGDVLLPVLARELEGIADDSLDARPREAHRHARDLLRCADAGSLPLLRVRVLGVLADDRHVNLLRALSFDGGETIVVQDDGTKVHEEVEAFPKADDHVALDHSAWRVRMADRAHEHGVHRADRRHLLEREPLAGREVMRAGPREARPLGAEPEAPLARVEHTKRGCCDLGTDAVAADNADPI